MPGQDVELVEHDAADAVDRHRVAQRHGVEPADPARPPGHRPELVAALGDPGADLVVQLGRIRPGPDPRRVRLHDADDLVDLERADAATGARAAGDRIGRGDERVAAVVEVEQRALRALEQDVLAAAEGRLDQPGRVVEMVAQALAPARGPASTRASTSKASAPIEPRTQVLVGQDALDPLAQDRRIEQVLHAQAEPPGAIAVGRPDPAPGRPDLGAAEPRLVRRGPAPRGTA